MTSPTDFIRACVEGKIWLFCKQCAQPRNYNAVEHLGIVENPTYWGTEPWWHDTRVFNCPECGTRQESVVHLDE